MKASLPIDEVVADVVGHLDDAGAVVVKAATGAGKTTRLPPAIAAAGPVWVVEPRRVAARAAARRMASEQGWTLGQEVGWHVRFDRRCRKDSLVVCMTPGILLRRLQSDPFLEGVGTVVFDEFHERSVDLDLGLALVQEVRREANERLRVLVMSATLDTARIASWLNAPVVESQGRTHPVEVAWNPRPDDRSIDAQVADGVRGALQDQPGDVLAFLPGVREIHRTAERLNGCEATVLPLYGDLSPDRQDAVLRPGDGRRVVLATNVAESSVTVPGVRSVVDSGWVRRPRFDPATGLDQLILQRVSAASADQRSGRAGRTAPGRAWRLWTHREQRDLNGFDPPELRRVSLAPALLQLMEWGADPETFGWFESPPADAVEEGLGLLRRLGAVREGGLTPLGHQLCGLPVHPRLGRMLLEGHRLGQGPLAALGSAWLSERDPLTGWSVRRQSDSDLLDRVVALADGEGHPVGRRAVMRVADQLAARVAEVVSVARRVEPVEALGRAVLAGWPDRVAMLRGDGRRARMVGGRGLVLSERSGVHDPLFVALRIRPQSGDSPVEVASAVERAWLDEEQRVDLSFDEEREAVRAQRVSAYGDLVLAAHPVEVDARAAGPLLEQAAAARLERVLPENDTWNAFVTRLGWLHDTLGDPWPDPDDAWLRQLLPTTCSGLRSFQEVRAADWLTAAKGQLGWERLPVMDQLAPHHLTIAGRRMQLAYRRDEAPVLAIRIQWLFGTSRTPAVCDGRVPLTLELLGPHGRPVQITSDLAGFWANTWPEIRKEMRGRYPKHHWPEDPHTADPRARPGRKR